MECLKLRCIDCGGLLEVDPTRKILSCPYCGSKQLMIDSDEVRIAELNAKTYENVEKERIKQSTKQGLLKTIQDKTQVESKKYDYKIEKVKRGPVLESNDLAALLMFAMIFIMMIVFHFLF